MDDGTRNDLGIQAWLMVQNVERAIVDYHLELNRAGRDAWNGDFGAQRGARIAEYEARADERLKALRSSFNVWKKLGAITNNQRVKLQRIRYHLEDIKAQVRHSTRYPIFAAYNNAEELPGHLLVMRYMLHCYENPNRRDSKFASIARNIIIGQGDDMEDKVQDDFVECRKELAEWDDRLWEILGYVDEGSFPSKLNEWIDAWKERQWAAAEANDEA